MNKTKQPTTLEKSVKKALFLRRLAVAGGVILFILVFAYGGLLFWKSTREPVFVPPVYDIDPESPNYWRDRTQADIDSSPRNESASRRVRTVYPRLIHTLNEAQRLQSEYQRIMAIYDIAVTMAVNSEDLNIDSYLRNLGDSSHAQSVYGRILISQSLMYLRIGNRTAARVAVQEYQRVVNEADLKLDSDLNDLAFTGAVTSLAVMKDTGPLTEVFNRQTDFTLRVALSRRSKAYRIIAGEQARVGMSLAALTTSRRITDPVEQVRAYQLVISLTARPPGIEPVEPKILIPKTEGPWEPIQAPVMARHIINDVLNQIGENVELDRQINYLMRLAGSRLMCDPEIYRIFMEAVAEFPGFDDLVKRPVLKLLREPRSDLIRASLGMPPIVRKTPQNVDPALDDWSSPLEALAVDMVDFAPEMMKTLIAVQTIRTRIMTAQSYLMVARYRDAAGVLRKTSPLARELVYPLDRIANLLLIGEKQINVGSFDEARETLLAVGLPKPGRQPDLSRNQDGPQVSLQEIFITERLSDLARLQTVARFFDDALETISCIESESQRNDDYAFLAMEQIRIRQFDDAERTVSLMEPVPRAETLRHILAVGRGGGEEHYAALNIPFPEKLNRDSDLRRACELLFRNGLYETAAKCAERIIDPVSRNNLLQRTAREYMLLYRAYRGENDLHRRLRKNLLSEACAVAGKIEDVSNRASLFESILSDAIPFAGEKEQRRFLLDLHEKTLETCRRVGVEEEKAELLGKMLLAKIALETPDRKATDAWPLIDRREHPEMYESLMELVEETLESVNHSNEGLKRGIAISHLARALGQVDRLQSAQKMIGEAREAARSVSQPKDAVSILLSLISTLRMLNDEDTARKIFNDAFTIVSESFLGLSVSGEKAYELLVRDSEFDRIISCQLENGFVDDAVEYTVRINDDFVRDRLYRTAAYIYLDQGKMTQAEITIRKTKHPQIFPRAIREILFTKRQAEKTGGTMQTERQTGTESGQPEAPPENAPPTGLEP